MLGIFCFFAAISMVSAKINALRTVTNNVHMLHFLTDDSYEFKLIPSSHETTTTGFPSHPFESDFSRKTAPHIKSDDWVEFPIEFKSPDPEEENLFRYSLTLNPKNNRLNLYRNHHNGNQYPIFMSNSFIKHIPANAGKSESSKPPSADLLMTEAVDGRRVPTFPNGTLTTDSSTCALKCHIDIECEFFVFATDGPDHEGRNCWLLKDVRTTRRVPNRVSGGNIQNPYDIYMINIDASQSEIFYGAGGDENDQGSLSFSASKGHVDQTAVYAPVFHSSAGYSIFAYPYANEDPVKLNEFPSQWEVTPAEWVAQTNLSRQVTWTIYSPPSSQAAGSIFIIPANSLLEHSRALQTISGMGLPPPLYAFGYSASQWGWSSPAYTESVLKSFRDGKIPIDSIIMDFEWYTPTIDYDFPETGKPDFVDFSYNAAVLPDSQLLDYYKSEFGVRFGGIRKPRLGNTMLLDIAKSRSWLLPNQRNLNFTRSDVRQWYTDNTVSFFNDGVDFFWNDEGEDHYFTFYYWNLAQIEAKKRTTRTLPRHFSINRAYTPGMQRLDGIVVWTGDVDGNWKSLKQNLGYLQNWSLMGARYVTFDTGGFRYYESTPELLVRWYQLAALTPIMRVHSIVDETPHFPFNYAEPYSSAMTAAIRLHYRLVPLFYSLGLEKVPIVRPLAMHFNLYHATKTTVDAYMIGPDLLVAPVVNQDSSVAFHLPAQPSKSQAWYEFDKSTYLEGRQEIRLEKLSLEAVPMYVRAGSILMLADPSTESTVELKNKKFELHIYATAEGQKVIQRSYFADSDFYGPHCGNVEQKFIYSESERSLRMEWNSICPRPHFTHVKLFTPQGVMYYNEWDGSEIII